MACLKVKELGGEPPIYVIWVCAAVKGMVFKFSLG